MGYPVDLCDIPTERLLDEIDRRDALLKESKCPYCSTDLSQHSCRYKDSVKESFHPGKTLTQLLETTTISDLRG